MIAFRAARETKDTAIGRHSSVAATDACQDHSRSFVLSLQHERESLEDGLELCTLAAIKFVQRKCGEAMTQPEGAKLLTRGTLADQKLIDKGATGTALILVISSALSR